MSEKWAKKDLCYKTKDEYDDQNGLIDGDIPLTLWKNGEWIAASAISKGLEDYFSALMAKDFDKEVYLRDSLVPAGSFDMQEKAAHYAKNLHGIVQMQARPKTQIIRGGIPYHDILVEGLGKLSEASGFKISFYLPAELNMWILPQQICDHQMDKKEVETLLSGLQKNYDRVAERHGFRYDREVSLYLKE